MWFLSSILNGFWQGSQNSNGIFIFGKMASNWLWKGTVGWGLHHYCLFVSIFNQNFFFILKNFQVHDNKRSTTFEIEAELQELVQLVLQNSSDGMESNIKETFFTVAKSFYYIAICDPGTNNYHISKVLFERVY